MFVTNAEMKRVFLQRAMVDYAEPGNYSSDPVSRALRRQHKNVKAMGGKALETVMSLCETASADKQSAEVAYEFAPVICRQVIDLMALTDDVENNAAYITSGVNLLFLYYFTPDLTDEDLAMQLNVSTQNVQQKIAKSLDLIWQYSSPELQNEFPLEKMNDRTSKNSVKMSPELEVVAHLLVQGATTVDLMRLLHVDKKRVTQWRQQLNYREFDIPPYTKEEYTIKAIDNARTPQEVQQALDLIDYHILIALHRSKYGGIVPLADIVRGKGLKATTHLSKYEEMLRQEGIPVRVIVRDSINGNKLKYPQVYRVVSAQDVSRIIELLDHVD